MSGLAFDFDQLPSYVEIPDRSWIDEGLRAFSVEGWIRPEAFTDQMAVINKGSQAAGTAFQILLDEGRLRVRLRVGEGPIWDSGFTGPIIQAFEWSHVGFVWDAASRSARVYLNGDLELSAITGVGPIVDNDVPIRIGGDDITGVSDPGFWQFYGQIDELAIYSRTVSTIEMRSIWDAGPDGKCHRGGNIGVGLSEFETSREDWTVIDNGSSVIPDWYADEGNPAAAIGETDATGNGGFYFQAPEEFLGDRSAAYGGALTFDMRVVNTAEQVSSEQDLLLVGSAGILTFDIPNDEHPDPEWRRYSIPVHATGGWLLDGDIPSAAEMTTILSDLQEVRIRGDWQDGYIGSEVTYLDNVGLAGAGTGLFVSISSSDASDVSPVDGTVPEQLDVLNSGVPVAGWFPVERHADHDPSSGFVCENASPLDSAYVNAIFPSGYLAEDDEVTYDNCGSGFYRFTFELPSNFTSPRIIGVANVDDQAVVFLNGHRISGRMTNVGCDPADDPGCYDFMDSGKDVDDIDGTPILTWPTRDLFESFESGYFAGGLNELVFGVCGDASPFEPTGVEFEALVWYEIDATSDVVVGSSVDLALSGIRVSPNPATNSVQVRLSTPSRGDVRVEVFDLSGRRVASVFDGVMDGGSHSVSWEASDVSGGLPAGVYVIRVRTADGDASEKVTIVR